MLHLNAQTLGATGEANTLGASVGDLKTPRLAIAKTQSGTTLCVTPPAVGADSSHRESTKQPLAERNGTNQLHHRTTESEPNLTTRSQANATVPPSQPRRRQPLAALPEPEPVPAPAAGITLLRRQEPHSRRPKPARIAAGARRAVAGRRSAYHTPRPHRKRRRWRVFGKMISIIRNRPRAFDIAPASGYTARQRTRRSAPHQPALKQGGRIECSRAISAPATAGTLLPARPPAPSPPG